VHLRKRRLLRHLLLQLRDREPLPAHRRGEGLRNVVGRKRACQHAEEGVDLVLRA